MKVVTNKINTLARNELNRRDTVSTRAKPREGRRKLLGGTSYSPHASICRVALLLNCSTFWQREGFRDTFGQFLVALVHWLSSHLHYRWVEKMELLKKYVWWHSLVTTRRTRQSQCRGAQDPTYRWPEEISILYRAILGVAWMERRYEAVGNFYQKKTVSCNFCQRVDSAANSRTRCRIIDPSWVALAYLHPQVIDYHLTERGKPDDGMPRIRQRKYSPHGWLEWSST